MTYEIRVRLTGSEDVVRARLDDLLDVLHDFASFVDATPGGAALKAGTVKGLYDEERWSRLCARVKNGTTHTMCIDRHTFLWGLFTAGHRSGLTMAHCWFWLGHPSMGTEIDLEYRHDDDGAISADDFRGWVDRIQTASGTTRLKNVEIDEKPVPTIIDLGPFINDTESTAEIEALARSFASPPDEVDGVAISGWELIGDEIEFAIVLASPLTLEDRAAVELAAADWARRGIDVGFGGGHFHYVAAEWNPTSYSVAVDSGAQLVDWPSAIGDLAQHIAQLSPDVASQLSIRLGQPTE